MHFSEDDLRAALKRKDPGEGFTQRVMARVNQAQAEDQKQPAKKKQAFWIQWKLHPVWAATVAVLLLLGFAFGGYEYSEYRHAEIARENQQRIEEAEKARNEAIQALEIARSKLNHVLQRAQLPLEINDKTRRERL
jgi:uncharacterized protein HemX